jgi:hypothetical protein
VPGHERQLRFKEILHMSWTWKAAGRLVTALLLALSFGSAARAQGSVGNIYGTVSDESGAVLPGATVTLSGPAGSRTTVTGGQGEFRFLNLDHGSYALHLSLTGFGTVARDVTVTTGNNVNLTFTMKVATVEETITVAAETPVVDLKRTGTSRTSSRRSPPRATPGPSCAPCPGCWWTA